MILHLLNETFCVCKLPLSSSIQPQPQVSHVFFARTPDELSLVCPEKDVPAEAIAREAGWRGFYIDGTLDFALVGILSKITTVLAEKHIPVFAVSTYNTDYLFVKEPDYPTALAVLEQEGYAIN